MVSHPNRAVCRGKPRAMLENTVMANDGIRYQYMLEIHRREPAAHLATLPVAPDFAPALEWATLEAIRDDPDRRTVLNTHDSRIEPRWNPQRGRPYVSGLQAVVVRKGSPAVEFDVPLSYFHNLAKTASSALVEAGKLEAGEMFEYRVLAYPAQVEAGADRQPRQAGRSFRVTPIDEALPVDEQSLERFLAESTRLGPEDEDQMPVVIPRQVLDETADLMRQAEATETGGVLIGHLHRDGDCGTLFLEVTAQIPARHAQAELTRLTFTPETWAAVDAAIALRAKHEMYVGWWHTHPAGHWCDDCPAETRKQCQAAGKLSGDFFSAHDAALHRTAFPRAFSVALVLSDGCHACRDPVWRLYGWRYDMIWSRGFHVLDTAAAPVAATSPVLRGGETDV